MASVAEELSDIVIVTSDNPRSEDPMDIIAEILPGFTQLSKVFVIADREDAIRSAVSFCTPDDLLLIAGKGHETTQIFSHASVLFDDRRVAERACAEEKQ
jgi:UDP-N-acetylmuramoyl-L-alanyl-D-glutamate--2,6-diaminopimelate ligase